MNYSILIGIASSFDFSFSGWLFFLIMAELTLIGLSVFLLGKISGNPIQIQIFYVLGMIVSCFLLFGLVGLFLSALTYFICYSFISDFKKDF